MIPPVSLPLNGGTVSACAGAPASIPPMTTRHTAPILRIADSISSEAHHNVRPRLWKEWLRQEADLPVRCCRVALDLPRLPASLQKQNLLCCDPDALDL